MSVLGNDSTSKTSSAQYGASDQAQVLVSGKGSNLLNSILLSGKGASYNTGLSGTATASWGGKVNQTITVNDLAKVDDLVNHIAAAQTDGLAKLSDTLSSGNKMALDKISELAANVQSGGETGRDKTVLWIVAIVAAGIVLAVLAKTWRRSNGS